jgi:hypothetical protein
MEDHAHYNWAFGVINSHGANGIEVRISHKELVELAKTEDAKKCAYCKTALNWVYGSKKKRVQDSSPTADRFNNENYLDRDNLRIVCFRCNRAKGDGTLEELISYCRRIYTLYGEATLPKVSTLEV